MMKTILITGASSGIGEALAWKSLNQGHAVIACGRSSEKLQQFSTHPNATCLAFDMTDLSQCRTSLSQVTCDIAVLNAGTCEYVDVEKFESDMFSRVMATNLFGATNILEILLPQLQAGSKIVFVDSLARLLPFTRSQAYGASKAAVHYLAKSLAVDLADRQITVQTQSPGFVKTPLTDKNDFSMPMQISADQAAEYMLRGLLSAKTSIYFPRRFSMIIRLLSSLPESIQNYLCRKMRTANENSSDQ